MKQHFKDQTHGLAKAMNHLTNAKHYLEDIRTDLTGELKQIFNHHINKIYFVITNITDRLSPESREILKTELSDTLCIDAINDNLIYLTNEQRLIIEKLIDAMIKGEDIQVEQNINY